MSDLREAFDESDLPFRVDIVQLERVDGAFRALIERNHEVITSV